MNYKEVLIGVGLFAVLATAMIMGDAVETFFEFSRDHEHWEFDEIVVIALSLLISVMISLIQKLRRQAAELQKEKEIAGNASEAKSQMIITVSHELRTPLTSIRGALGLLEMGYREKYDEKTRDLIDIASRNVSRLVNLIEATLSIERITNEVDEFVYSDTSSGKLLSHTYEENHLIGDSHGVTLKLEKQSSDFQVRIDENRVMQVFANLISNAARYSARGTDVLIGCTEKADSVVFFVKDSGSGIPQGFHDHAFERFTRADASESNLKGGAGLGLPISKAIIEQHGGKIWFESATDLGTTFYFELPKA